MLEASDVIAGKIAVQLGMAAADVVREHLRALDAAPGDRRNLLNHLHAADLLDEGQLELLRHRTALYEHVRREASYVRLLERNTTIQKQTVARLLAQLERSAFRRRLGEVLVKRGNISAEYDQELQRTLEDTLTRDEARILGRYRAEGFAGVARPLIARSRLEPEDFKISTLFRGKETRALVDRAELNLLRQEAEQAARAEAEAAATLILDGPEGGAAEDGTSTVILGDERQPVDPYGDTAKLAPGAASLPDPIPDLPRSETFSASRRGLGELQADEADEAADDDDDEAPANVLTDLERLADYAIVEVLGTGGMGAVFLAQKDGAGEYVAIKVLLNGAATEEEKGRFAREVELTRRVGHPGVIGILDAGEAPGGMSYLVVPALAGKELRDLLGEGGLEPALAARVLTQLLEALEAVHQAGIVHRDLKPENVFVLAGGDEVRLMDFGLAKPADEARDEVDVFLTQTGEVSGSPAYIAPESVTGDPIDGRTDIYSLGILLFEMLTGQLPLSSETSQGYLTQHMICPPATLAEARPDRAWSPELEGLLERMLAKTRGERPESCAAILAELEGGLAEAIRASAPPAPESEPVEEDAPAEPAPASWGFRGLLGRLLGPSR